MIFKCFFRYFRLNIFGSFLRGNFQFRLFLFHISANVFDGIISQSDRKNNSYGIAHVSAITWQIRNQPEEKSVKRKQGKSEKQGPEFMLPVPDKKENSQGQYRGDKKQSD